MLGLASQKRGESRSELYYKKNIINDFSGQKMKLSLAISSDRNLRSQANHVYEIRSEKMDSSQKFIDLRLTLRRTPIPTVSDVLWDKRILYGKATELVRDEGFKKNQHFHLFALTEAGKETLKEP